MGVAVRAHVNAHAHAYTHTQTQNTNAKVSKQSLVALVQKYSEQLQNYALK